MASSPSGPIDFPRIVGAAILALFMAAVPLMGQGGGALAGRVVGPSGEAVAGAAVTLSRSDGGRPQTSRSGRAGEFRFGGVVPGRYRLRATRVGFGEAEREVDIIGTGEERVDLRLAEAPVVLERIEVTGRESDRERTRFERDAGVTARVIGGGELKVLPGLGEADVLRAVELLPGVVSTSDFSSAFNVRGGSADQNLILLDGFTIFNPFHLGGLFSVFNSDLIARAELMAGGFGAEHGGRVSSVLSVETQTGSSPRLSGEAGVSLLASRLALHSDLPRAVGTVLGGDRGSWFISGRRSYFDVLLGSVIDFPYHLTDVQGGLTFATRGGGRVRFSGYTGDDVLDLSDFQPPGGGDDEGLDPEDEEESILRIRWNWGNDVAGVRWEQPLRAGWSADTRLGFSRYSDRLGFVDFADTRFSSSVEQLQLRSDLRRTWSPALSSGTGVEIARLGYANRGETGGTVFFASENRGVMGAGYLQLRWQPTPAWILEPGVRTDVWNASDFTHALVSPRFAAKRFLGPQRDAAVKLAVGRYVQFLHSLRDEQLPVSNDTWVTADRDIPPIVSDQVQLGVEKFWGDEWNASAEGYFRSFRGVTDFNPADDPNDPADDLLVGRGTSYGLDLFLRRSAGALTGWTSVSLLRARRTFPDPAAIGLEGVPEEVTFPPVFDRTLDVDVVLQYRLPWNVETGARFNFGSGVPYSRPVGQHVGWETDLLGGGYRLPNRRGEYHGPPLYVVPGRRNAERYPAYHRLDVTFRRRFNPGWGTLTPYLQVLNTYNRRNVLFYFYNYNDTTPTRSGISMFPVLPTIGVEASF